MSFLTILIPNYNRVQELGKLLESVFRSIDVAEASAAVEVVVVDDFSTVDLSSIAYRFGARPNFRFESQRVKCGNAETAFLNALEHVRTEYTWLVGNDDALLPVAVSVVAKILREYSPGIVILNPELFKASLRRAFNPIVSDSGAVIYSSAEDLFLDFGFVTSTTTFSCIVVQTRAIRDFHRRHRLTETATVYAHTFSLFGATRGLRAVFVANPLVRFTLNERVDEQAKLQKQAPLNIPFFHQSLGVARLCHAAAQICGVPVSVLASAKEDEVDKDALTVFPGTLRHFMAFFLLQQMICEQEAVITGSRGIGHLCQSELLEILGAIMPSDGSGLFELTQAALGVVSSAHLPKEWKLDFLKERQAQIRKMGSEEALKPPVGRPQQSALKILGPNMVAVPLRGVGLSLGARMFSAHREMVSA